MIPRGIENPVRYDFRGVTFITCYTHGFSPCLWITFQTSFEAQNRPQDKNAKSAAKGINLGFKAQELSL